MMGWKGRSPLGYGKGDRIDFGTMVIEAIAGEWRGAIATSW
ncbi:MAG: hypothetical protein AAGD25_14895 [Cyanobacteria bacterium P01_F01_bin.150]